jgi:hypothetical protein
VVDSFVASDLAALAVFIALPLLVLVLAVIILAGREPDTTGRRALAVYLAAVSFVAIFTAVFASFAAVVSLADLIIDGRSEDAAVRGAVQGALVVGAALIVLVFHARRRRELQRTEEYDTGAPAWRIDRAYLYTVCFVAILVALFALGVGAYGLFRVLAPGVTADELSKHLERQEGVAQLVSLTWLGAVGVLVFLRSWREVTAEPA